MQNKQPPFRSIDGFTPRNNNAPRQVGFGMPKKPVQNPRFPAVGQTLSSYAPAGTIAADRRLPPNSRGPIDLELDGTAAQKVKKQGRLRRLLRWKRVMSAFLILILAIGGWLGFKFVYNASKTFHGGIFSVLTTTKLKGEDVGRVNILLAGNSSDDVGHDGGNLTDSIMIISINTKDNTAYMLSVPRDLWVDIPDNGHAKINEAYVDGQDEKFSENGYFPGGMGLLQKVIQDNFNINLNYYALIDYNALKEMVDAVGGIDFTVKSQDKRGLYDPSIDWTTHGPLVKLSNGIHHLNGQQALDLARARGDAYGSYGFPAADFDRTNNQRQELLALKSKVTSTGVLANPAKLSSLMDAIGGNIKTNFSLGEVHRLYDIGKKISDPKSVGLNNVNGKNLLMSYASPNGQSALAPAAGVDDFSDIQQLIKQLTSSNPVVREGANVVVLNATDTSGIAAKARTTLRSKGLDVTATGDALANQATTSIIDVSGGKLPATKKLLITLYGNIFTTTNPYVNIYDADFIVIIGQDRVPKPTATATSP